MSAFYEAALPAAAIFLILAAAYRAAHKPRTRTPRPASCPSTGAGRGHDTPACHSTGPRGGHYYRADGDEWVCASCGDRVPRGQADVYDQELTDRQIREVMDDARRITREASGGVA